MNTRSSRFNPAQDPERNWVGGNPDPEDDPYEHELEFVDEGDLLDDLIALGLYADAEAVMFTEAP